MKFDGMIFVPEGQLEEVMPRKLDLPDEERESLFGEFKRALKRSDGFTMEFDVSGGQPPLTVMHKRDGLTAGHVIWGVERDGQVIHTHGFTALLTKIDPADDRRAVEAFWDAKALRGHKRESFDLPLNHSSPVAATFFADHESASYGVLTTMIELLSAAFFDMFGVAHEDDEH
jgi:hypothetical protein